MVQYRSGSPLRDEKTELGNWSGPAWSDNLDVPRV